MNLEERIGTAWKEYDDSSPQMKNRENFSAGYLAAMRSLYVEVKPVDLAVGKEYTALIRQDDGSVSWFDGVMVSLSDEMRVCKWGQVANATFHQWTYWLKSNVVFAVAENPIPSPAEIF